MTDYRATREASCGHAGRLSYYPLEIGAQADDCGLLSPRDLTLAGPIFRELSAYDVWHSSACEPQHDSLSGDAFQKSKQQKNWLLMNHPTAHLGNSILRKELSEHHASPEERVGRSAVRRAETFALGELVDITQSSWAASAPLIATARGPGQNVLHLEQAKSSSWQWGDDGALSLRLAETSGGLPACWRDIIGPIRRLKCVVDSKRFDPTRWVISQWDSETRVFQPELVTDPVDLKPQVRANPLFSITRHQTGGRHHSDVSFNPGTRSQPPQLALVDDSGSWSVWNVSRTRKTSAKPVVSMCKHGDLQSAPSRQPSLNSRNDSDSWHIVLFVGGQESEYAAEDEIEDYGSSITTCMERSSALIFCDSKAVYLFDLNTDSFVIGPSFVPADGPHVVLDAKLNPQQPRHCFILTTSKLFLVYISTTRTSTLGAPKRHWTILFSIPHFRNISDRSLCLTTTPGPRCPGLISTLVTIHSSAGDWLDVFSVRIQKIDPERVLVHRESHLFNAFPGSGLDSPVAAIALHPASISVPQSAPVAPSSNPCMNQQVQFYQAFVSRSDQELGSILVASSYTVPMGTIVAPDRKIEQDVVQVQIKQRKQALRNLASRFVIPDNVFPSQSQSQLITANHEKKGQPALPVARRFLGFIVERLGAVLGDEKPHGLSGQTGEQSLDELFHSRIQKAMGTSIGVGILPASTLHETFSKLAISALTLTTASPYDVDTAIDRLRLDDHSLKFTDLFQPDHRLPPTESRSLSTIQSIIYQSTLDMTSTSTDEDISTIAPGPRSIAIRKMAFDIFSSLLGISAPFSQPTPPFGQDPQFKGESLDASQDDTLPGRHSSQMSVLASSPISEQPVLDEDPAMMLLKTMTGTGRALVPKDMRVLSRWSLGADPHDYVFDLEKDKEITSGMQRAAKKMAKEDRKRRRTETLLNRLQEQHPESAATQPGPGIRFSQPRGEPASSQSMQTMSQPLAGTFAQRPKKKAKRRQGGFK